ncbi:restriction endonuclease subunit S [Clostridium sp.]|uniref:restriction endonuclease subunit S n=1 Tax=Clostridium sp. TaxID=1506 RepID=UPI0025BC49FD|nr:restriction endonuclease subunit S [Clostridium sp.]MDY4251169.1 restriction endonuclease subunit S [Clostridium sp.]
MKKVREGYKNTELGQTPSSWMIKTIGEIFDFSGGLSISRAMLTDKGINYLHYGDIHMRKENYIDTKKDEEWLPKLEDNFQEIKDNVKLNTGDIVFADASEDYEGIGKSVVIFNELKRPFVSGLHTIVAKDINKELDNNYKRYCFSTNEVRKQFRQLAVGTSVYGISRENIKKIKISIPTLEEQEQIGKILSTVDEQIDNIDALIEKNNELKKGLMQQLLTKGIGHTKFKKTEIGEIPEEWEVKRLIEISDIIMGQSPDSSSYNEEGNGVPFFQGKTEFGSINPVVRKWCTSPTKIAKPLDILISVRAPVGDVNINNIEACIGRGLGAIRQTNRSNYKYIYYVIQMFSNELRKSSQGSTFEAINSSDLKGLKLPTPELEEQQKIATILSEVDEKIEGYKNKKQKLEELKKGLMQQLLTGAIRAL